VDLTKKATPFAILRQPSRASFAAECGGEYDMSMRSVALARRSTAAYFQTIGETGPGGRPKRGRALFGRAPAASLYALIPIGNIIFEALAEGGLWWEEERLLVVADLHLEKGSAFAKRRLFLPPYDTAATLTDLSLVIDRLRPKTVIALGDSFHDDGGPERLHSTDRETLVKLQSGREWIWVAGNHDPKPHGLNGHHAAEIAIGPITFRHEPGGASENEIAGHLHPAARVAGRFGSTRRPCFVANGRRVVLPAFGAYTGGLNILDAAFDMVFGHSPFRAYVIGDKGVYPVHEDSLRPD
jgi:DNA ligase-associated metallophosphoesterase